MSSERPAEENMSFSTADRQTLAPRRTIRRKRAVESVHSFVSRRNHSLAGGGGGGGGSLSKAFKRERKALRLFTFSATASEWIIAPSVTQRVHR